MITAWLVVSIVLVYYIEIYNADLDPFQPLDISTLAPYPNPVDRALLSMIRKAPLLNLRDSQSRFKGGRLQTALQKVGYPPNEKPLLLTSRNSV